MPDADKLWKRWAVSRDDDVREDLVRHYWPLVRSVAGAVSRPRFLGLDELESHASLGLLDAIDRYDHHKGPFENYARGRMRGAVVDGIREHDRASRTNLGRAKALDGAMEELTTRLSRPPTEAELAGRLGVPVAKLRAFHHARLATTVGTLDILPGDLGFSDPDGAPHSGAKPDGDWIGLLAVAQAGDHDVATEVEHRLRQATLAKALDQIDGPDRAVLVLYYVTGMTMAEIGDVLGVATARVSQIHTRAVRALKANLQPTLPTLEESQ